MRVTAGLAVLVLVASTFAACLGLGTNPCYGISTSWHQEGLFEAFPEPGHDDRWTIHWRLEPESLPLDNASLNALFGPERYALETVEWRSDELVPSRGGQPLFTLTADGLVDARVSDRVHEEELRGAFGAFVSNVTAAGEETREGWADAFIASGQHEGTAVPGGEEPVELSRYSVNVTGPYRLDALVDEIGVDWPQSILSETSPGGFSEAAGPWTFDISFPTKHAEGEQTWGERVERVTVDTFDGVRVISFQDEEDFNTTRGLLEEGFESLRLPEPQGVGVDDARLDSVC